MMLWKKLGFQISKNCIKVLLFMDFSAKLASFFFGVILIPYKLRHVTLRPKI